MEKCPDQSGWVGGREGRKERWVERKEKMVKDLGDIFTAKVLKRLYSTFSREGGVAGGVGIGCWGTGDTFVTPGCQHRGGGSRVVLRSYFFIFSGVVLTASSCGSADTMAYFLPFFILTPSLLFCMWYAAPLPPPHLSPSLSTFNLHRLSKSG